MRRISPNRVGLLPGLHSSAFLYCSFFLLLLALSVLLAGCGRNREDESLIPLDLTPVAITYVTFNDGTGTEQTAIDLFQEQTPGIEVERQTFQRNPANYLLDTPSPDVMFLWDGHLLQSAATQGLLSDLSDVWSENRFEEAYGEQFREMSRFEGNLYFVPGGFSWTGIYYNKDIFNRYGLTPPQTWEAFLQICDTLLVNGETPLSLAGSNPFISTLWFEYLNMRLNGPEFHHSLIAGREDYTDDRVRQVWELWISLLNRGYFIESPGNISELSSMTALIRGDADSPLNRHKAVMALATPFTATDLPSTFRDELDFFQFPLMDVNRQVGEASITFGYVIPAGAPNRPQAGAFVGFMGNLQLLQFDSDAGYVPVHADFDRSLLGAASQRGEQVVRSADHVSPPFFLAIPNTMQVGFTQAIRRLFLNTNKPIDIAEIQGILENARQEAIQNGEYTP